MTAGVSARAVRQRLSSQDGVDGESRSSAMDEIERGGSCSGRCFFEKQEIENLLLLQRNGAEKARSWVPRAPRYVSHIEVMLLLKLKRIKTSS